EVQAAVTGDERKPVALEQRTKSAVGLHAVDLPAEELEALKPESGDVLDDLFNGVRIGESGRPGAGGVAPGPGNTGMAHSDVPLALSGNRQCSAEQAQADGTRKGAAGNVHGRGTPVTYR